MKCGCGAATPPRLQPVIDAGSIVLKDADGAREVRIALASGDIAKVLKDAALILIPSPATAQADIARAMAPHLASGQVVFLAPGTFGSYVMARIVRDSGNRGGRALGRDRHLAVSGAQARRARSQRDHPRRAAADRRLSGAARAGRDRGDPPGLSRACMAAATRCRVRS